MRMIGLLSGGWTEERLRQAGCIEVYRHPADLLARYDHSALGPAKGNVNGLKIAEPIPPCDGDAR